MYTESARFFNLGCTGQHTRGPYLTKIWPISVKTLLPCSKGVNSAQTNGAADKNGQFLNYATHFDY